MKQLLLSLMAGGLLISGCNGSTSGNIETDVTVSGPGHVVFLENCAACHRGPGGAPNRVILNSPSLASAEAFRQVLRHPPTSMMPAFSEERISDASAQELYDYILSIRDDGAVSQ